MTLESGNDCFSFSLKEDPRFRHTIDDKCLYFSVDELKESKLNLVVTKLSFIEASEWNLCAKNFIDLTDDNICVLQTIPNPQLWPDTKTPPHKLGYF